MSKLLCTYEYKSRLIPERMKLFSLNTVYMENQKVSKTTKTTMYASCEERSREQTVLSGLVKWQWHIEFI